MNRFQRLAVVMVLVGVASVAIGLVQGPVRIEGAYFDESVSSKPRRVHVFDLESGMFWAGAGAVSIGFGLVLALVARRPAQ